MVATCFSLAFCNKMSPALKPSWHLASFGIPCFVDVLKITLKHWSNAGLRRQDDDAGNHCPPLVGRREVAGLLEAAANHMGCLQKMGAET